ncbi:unnamed protein product [Ixodes pacificus]
MRDWRRQRDRFERVSSQTLGGIPSDCNNDYSPLQAINSRKCGKVKPPLLARMGGFLLTPLQR